MDTTQQHFLSRARKALHLSPADIIAIVAAILSLLTFTVLLPSGVHLPW